jgi:hypothetical protein
MTQRSRRTWTIAAGRSAAAVASAITVSTTATAATATIAVMTTARTSAVWTLSHACNHSQFNMLLQMVAFRLIFLFLRENDSAFLCVTPVLYTRLDLHPRQS